MNKLWIVGAGILAIVIVGIIMLKSGGGEKTTTSTSTETSNSANGLLSAIAGLWGGVVGATNNTITQS